MSQPIVLYDVYSTLPAESRAWAPNPWKIRIILNYKRIPFTTVWIEYADVGKTISALGAPPSAHYPDGSPRYTVPTIHDPNTERTVMDSVEIAKYLDEQYPDRLFLPNGAADQQAAFAESVKSTLAKPVFAFLGHGTFSLLSEYNHPILDQRLRAFVGGVPFAERPAPSEEEFKDVCQAYLRLADLLHDFKRTNDIPQDQLLFVDCACLGFLKWLQRTVLAEQFENLLGMDGGKWQEIYDRASEFMTVDEGTMCTSEHDVQKN